MPRGPGLALAELVAAEDRRLAAMRGVGQGPTAAVACAIALAVHAVLLFVPVRTASGRAPELPKRPAGIPVLRWMPVPEPGDLRPQSTEPRLEGPPAEPERPAIVRRGPLPAWILEPVPEPPPSARLRELPADASMLPVPPPAEEDAVPVPVEVVRPLPIPEGKVEPEFPAVARALRAHGSVVLEVAVGIDGAVTGARVLECTRPGVGFERAALEAVRKWTFRPGRLGDEPVAATTIVRVEFR